MGHRPRAAETDSTSVDIYLEGTEVENTGIDGDHIYTGEKGGVASTDQVQATPSTDTIDNNCSSEATASF